MNGKAINVFGPRPTQAFVDKLIGDNGAYRPDWEARIHWVASQETYVDRGGSLPRVPPAFVAQDIEPGFKHKIGTSTTVTAALAVHAQPYLDCLSYRFDTPYGSVVFSGDTQYCPSIVELAKEADLFFCMASGGDMGENKTGRCPAGVADAKAAGRIAAEAGVKKLVLTHTGPQSSKDSYRAECIADASEIFQGEIVFGEEISSFLLG